MENLTTRLQQIFDTIDEGGVELGVLIGAADGFSAAGDVGLALATYKYWLRANTTHPLRHVAAFNCGCILLQIGKLKQAADYLRQSIDAKADFYPGYLNLASAYERSGDTAAALAELQKALDGLATINPMNISYKVQALRNIGRIGSSPVLSSEAALKQAVEIDPSQDELLQHWVNRRQGGCIWPPIEKVGVLSEIDVIKRLAPLSMAAYIDDPRLQLAGAKRYSLQMEKNPSPCRVIGAWPQPVAAKRPQKVRVGYLSSDFSNHAVGYLMSDVFENHDRSKFEITVFNIGPRNDDALQTKIIGQVDRWFDLTGLPDRTAAALIVREGCDILIDMNGHTNHQRTGVLALKPAPVIVNWLGYPGTMGSSYHHYILADDFIVTPDLEPFYSETVLRLPCYQPNGRLYEVQQSPELRADLGLPETGVVFCCFNGSVKITEPVFSRWMTILASVPGSVIWMRGKSGDDHARRMQAEAVRRGIAPERLVFLSFRSNTEYLGCHRYADLFLDSFPYGAHTTASDALRMGMPIVTLAGHSFASRVCGSLSIAAGLPELVCESREQYVALAIALGNDPAKLAQVKARLKASLPTCVLFDARRLVTSLEELFEQMWGAYATGSLRQPCIDVIDIDRVTPILGNGISPDVVSRADYLRRIRLED